MPRIRRDPYEEENVPKCSFCGKTMLEVRLIAGTPHVNICKECVELCVEIFKDEDKKRGA